MTAPYLPRQPFEERPASPDDSLRALLRRRVLEQFGIGGEPEPDPTVQITPPAPAPGSGSYRLSEVGNAEIDRSPATRDRSLRRRGAVDGILAALASGLNPNNGGIEGFLRSAAQGASTVRAFARPFEDQGQPTPQPSRAQALPDAMLRYAFGEEPAPKAPRELTGSDFEIVTQPDGTLVRVPKIGAQGVIPGVRAPVPGRTGPAASTWQRATPGSPEHRQGWILERARQISDKSQYEGGFGIDPQAAYDRAAQEYEINFPSAPGASRTGPYRGGYRGGQPRNVPQGSDMTAPIRAPGGPGPVSAPPPAGDPVEKQRALYDSAAAQLRGEDEDPVSILGPRP